LAGTLTWRLESEVGVNVLGTAAARTSWTEVSGLVRQHEQVHNTDYRDFTVDDAPLHTLVWQLPQTPGPVQEMTWLQDEWPDEAVEQLRRLLGDAPGDYRDGRVALLVCNVCGDLGCRSLSASLVATEQQVEWRDLGWQVNYEPFDATEDGFAPPLTFRFDRSQYTKVLRELLAYFEERLAVEQRAVADVDHATRPRSGSRLRAPRASFVALLLGRAGRRT